MTTLVSGGAMPVGALLPFAGDSGQVPDGFLLCNGALLNRNDFADLFTAISTHWGTDSGLDFRIPTTQGLHLRGTAYGSGNDPDRNSRTAVATGAQAGDEVGSLQTWRAQSHNHFAGHSWHINSTGNANFFFPYGYASQGYGQGNSAFAGTGMGNASNRRWPYTSSSGSSQTCGKNVNVNYIIKY